MNVAHLELLVEEPSMEAALRILLPRLVGKTTFEIYPHQGKPDLLAKLPCKLAAYARWLPEDHRVLVIVDRDRQDCVELKRKLEGFAQRAGLATPSRSAQRWRVASRFAIEELEAWYFGDWAAVRAAYPKVKATVPNQAPFRAPDGIAGGTCEAFERELQRAGYFVTGLRKIEVARAVAQHMQPARNTSPSFQKLAQTFRGLGPQAE